MIQSSFIQYIKKYFPGITVSVVEKLNDTTRTPSYLHRRLLREEYSITGKWESVNAAHTRVAADIVAMDSQLPLKKRDSISRASGDIPKMGMKLYLNENQLTELDTLVNAMASRPSALNQLLAKLFSDTPRCIEGVYERLEAMFLQGLSTGVTVVEDTETVGTGVRVDYGYLSANQFGVAAAWTGTSFKPFDDIRVMLDKATEDGNTPNLCLIDRATLDKILATDQAKELFAFTIGMSATTTSKIPIPDLAQINRMTASRYGFTFEIVDRSIRYERNGQQSVVKPWASGALVFIQDTQVGSLVYATLAEENHPVDGVSYSKANAFILVSKYRTNDPLSEHTSSQARVVPVISNVDRIYRIDSTSVNP